jgi:hypothetical protein
MYSTSDRAQTVKQCLTCGADFVPPRNRPDKKFCCDQCRSKHNSAAGSPHEYTCQQCGKVYRAKKKDRATFCSRECSSAYYKEHGRPERRKPKPEPRPMPACEVCGKPVKARGNKTCSPECKAERTRQEAKRYWESKSGRDRQPRACKECGKTFVPEYGNKKRYFDSDECLQKYSSRVGKASRRARIHNAAVVESVDPIKVFIRDGWRCKLCGCSTPRRLRGTIEDRAPELDHVVPLALGGTHTYSNTQCTCRKCNQAKGATTIGQMGLL